MKAAASLLLTVLWASGCGLGTEVGNGAHPSTDGGKGGAAAGSDKQANPTDAAQTPTAAGAGGNTSAGATPGAAGNADVPAAWEKTAGFDFDLSLLTQTCASPLGATLDSPVTLAKKAADGTRSDELKLTLETDGTWTVADKDGKTLRHVTKGTAATAKPFPVSSTDSDAKAVTGGYGTCQAPKTKTLANGDVETAVVVLTPNAGTDGFLSTTVTWDLSGQALVKVVLSGYGVTGGSVELDAQ